MEWITQQQDDVPEDRFDADCTAAVMGRTSKRPHEVCWVLVHGTEQSYRWNTTSIGEKRTTPRWSERLGRLRVEYAPVTSATAQGFMKKSLDIPRAKTTSDVSSAIQMLEELQTCDLFRSDLSHAECARVRMKCQHQVYAQLRQRRLLARLRKEHRTGACLGVARPRTSAWLKHSHYKGSSKKQLTTGT